MIETGSYSILDKGTLTTARSQALHSEACAYSPAGVQGEGRFYKPFPLYISRAKGARLWDIDGNEYVDYHGSYGPAVLGYADDRVTAAVKESMDHEGVLFSLPHPKEVQLARLVSEVVPSAEKTVFVCSGSEAVYHAVRVARAYTGREKIVKFEGSYHGWFDDVAASIRPSRTAAGSAQQPNVVPASAGSLKDTLAKIIVVPFNDGPALERAVSRSKNEIAAILVEPVLHNCGCVRPLDGFLQLVRDVATDNGIVLVFDEVITGFRHHQGGCQAIFGVTPDLTCFGKAFANGFAISGLTGKREIMSLVGPEGPVFFSGTFNAHLLNVTAALKTQEILRDGQVYQHTWRLTELLAEGINHAIKNHGVRARCQTFGSIWSLYFTDREVQNYRDAIPVAASKEDPATRAYVSSLWNNGIYIQPFYVVRSYVSAAHSEEDIQKTIDVTERFFRENRAALR